MLVWPDNRQAALVFIAMQTQWLSGMGGYTGLNYASLPEIWRRLKVPPAERDTVFADLKVMEITALNTMHTKED